MRERLIRKRGVNRVVEAAGSVSMFARHGEPVYGILCRGIADHKSGVGDDGAFARNDRKACEHG